MSEVYGESPRPWTLVIGKPLSDSEKLLIESLPGTVTQREDPDQVGTVRQADFDAAIVFGSAPVLDSHLMVMQIGGNDVGEWIRLSNAVPYRFVVHLTGRAALLTIESENIPDGVSVAAQRALAEHIRSQQPHGLINRAIGNNLDSNGVTPLVREKDGSACAGWWLRGEKGGAEWWWFPWHSPNLSEWREAIYASWSTVSPQAFPNPSESWAKSPEWMTVKEISAARAVEEYRSETEGILSVRKSEEERLEQFCQQVTAEADSADRLLVTAQGKPLVSAVSAMLGGIGFTVVDSDEQKIEGAALLEDLQVIYGNWICLAEVRGYAKGAKTSDFQRIERAVRHYEREHGSGPSARWYVVNHNLKNSPNLRPVVLAGAADDVDVFAEECGLVIDTRELFKLAKLVEGGAISNERARALLMSSTGVFSAVVESDS
ncbi:hypothetical protein [Streptomyces sp. NPDC012510]|uniref:hypothetical protein n=1 Tax=Streptomyces sp. NPDC012510 TaxID=3364838 RepID=UPI0036E67D08